MTGDIHDMIAQAERVPGGHLSIDREDPEECPDCGGPVDIEQDRWNYHAVCVARRPCIYCTIGSGPVLKGTGTMMLPDGLAGYCECEGEDGTECHDGDHIGCGYEAHAEDPRIP